MTIERLLIEDFMVVPPRNGKYYASIGVIIMANTLRSASKEKPPACGIAGGFREVRVAVGGEHEPR
jgi:hypothetical protein